MSFYICLAITFLFFFFNDTATTEIYTLSLHDALPIFRGEILYIGKALVLADRVRSYFLKGDRKSTRLNSSHSQISYAVFCLKKKKKKYPQKLLIHKLNRLVQRGPQM